MLDVGCWTFPTRRGPRAFTLIELLVVIVIIGILAAIVMPSLPGFGRSNAMAAANRQLLDDFSLARLKAINNRTTVYVVFVPELDPTFFADLPTDALSEPARKLAFNLLGGQYSSYAIFARRNVGEQPGREYPRYLTDWKSLPDGVFFAVNKFADPRNRMTLYNETNRPFARTNNFPFPTGDTLQLYVGDTIRGLPYIAFNSRGQLISEERSAGQYEDAIIPLARGSIFYKRDAEGNLVPGTPDVLETPRNNSIDNHNRVRIDWLTGRARIERPELQ